MSTYVAYELQDGSSLWIEADIDHDPGVVEASLDEGTVVVRAGKSFQEALQSAKAATALLIAELKDMPVDQLEVTFGLKATGEAGLFAISKLGLEANYEVKLKWKKPS